MLFVQAPKIESTLTRLYMYHHLCSYNIIRKLHQLDNGQALFLTKVPQHCSTSVTLCGGSTPYITSWLRKFDVPDDEFAIESSTVMSDGSIALRFAHTTETFVISSNHVTCGTPWKCETIAVNTTTVCTILVRWCDIFTLEPTHKIALSMRRNIALRHRANYITWMLYHRGLVRDIVWSILELDCELLRLDPLRYCVRCTQ